MESQIIQLYTNGVSGCKLAKQFNTSTDTIYKILERNNIKRRSNKQNSRIYKADDNYFCQIDTEEKAYWLGFLYADGYITSSGSSKLLGISLKSTDKSHIEKLKLALQTDYPINTYTGKTQYGTVEYSRLLINSEKIFDSLNKIGMTERKSLSLVFPNLQEDLRIHFIRGYFDGDGSWTKDKKSSLGYSFKLCGTKELLTEIALILNINLHLYKRYKDDKNNYYISVSGSNKVFTIMNLLYKDANIYLQRKYERYWNCPFKQQCLSKNLVNSEEVPLGSL